MSAAKVAELFAKLNVSATPEDRSANGADVVKAVKADGLGSMAAVADQLKAAIEDTAAPLAREAGLVAFSQLVAEFGAKSEPYLFPLLPVLLERAADKVAGVRAATETAATDLFAILNPYSTENALPALFEGMDQARNWQTKVLAINLLAGMSKTAPTQIASCLHAIVPRLTGKHACNSVAHDG